MTVIEFMDRLCPAMDTELTKKFQTTLKKQGFKFKLKTKVVKSEVQGDGVAITTEPAKVCGGARWKMHIFPCSPLIVTGRGSDH